MHLSKLLLPLLSVTYVAAQECDGILKGNVCCVSECDECGGVGCSSRNGLTGDDCCTANIIANDVPCGSAPCILGEDTAPTPTPPSPTPPEPTSGTGTCDDGILQGDVCCVAECETCGGVGCSDRGGGLTADDCCTSAIRDAGVTCGSPPCIVDEDNSPTPSAPSPVTAMPIDEFECDGPVRGDVCCAAVCGTQCGGSGCAKLGSGSAEECCTNKIISNGDSCLIAGAGPCLLNVDVPAPSPVTPTPVTPTPVTPTPVTPTPTGPSPTMPTSSPTPVMTIPTDPSDCEGGLPDFRYAEGTGLGGRLYAETEGCFTLTDMYNFRGIDSTGGVLTAKGPLYQLDDNDDIIETVTDADAPVTGKWLLTAELYMTNGAIFFCKGRSAGGDCDVLRIQSTGSTDFHEVRGHGGSLYFEDTLVTSWNTPTKEVQTTYTGGRSFINCVSEKLTGETCEGKAQNERGECRMDIINSEMGHLGYFDSESYGLTWKVRGFCVDKSNPEVFDGTNVYGDIKGSDIHHMYYGMYSYGHQGGVWTNNQMHDNYQYGFDPHDDSDYLTIADNEVYNNVNHGIIASKRCNNVQIYGNTVRDGGAQAAGIFLHRSSDSAEVYDNVITDMQDAGIALLESFDAQIHDNIIDGAKYGIRMSLGSGNNQVYDNIFNSITDYGLYTYQGSDEPTEGVSDGRPSANVFDKNTVSESPGGVKFKYSDNIVCTNNDFPDTEELEFFDAQGTVWLGNSVKSGACVDNISSDDGNTIERSTFAESENLPGDC